MQKKLLVSVPVRGAFFINLIDKLIEKGGAEDEFPSPFGGLSLLTTVVEQAEQEGIYSFRPRSGGFLY